MSAVSIQDAPPVPSRRTRVSATPSPTWMESMRRSEGPYSKPTRAKRA
ncbi:hypothetical protein COSO111634_05290 [Corallococcus soli]